MAVIEWDTVGERFFQTGVDHGVLYIGSNEGVAWNGLVSVTEKLNGADARPFYIDGYKFRNTSAHEEFEATIQAYWSPIEFGECDGITTAPNGLMVTAQRRKKFGFTYRTNVGNDTNGSSLGYRLHIIYNALALPSDIEHASINDDADATIFGWNITTSPDRISGYRPTGHYIIDSRNTPDILMGAIERVLYGTDEAEARLPSSEELAFIFGLSWEIMTFTTEGLPPEGNLVLNSQPDSLDGYSASGAMTLVTAPWDQTRNAIRLVSTGDGPTYIFVPPTDTGWYEGQVVTISVTIRGEAGRRVVIYGRYFQTGHPLPEEVTAEDSFLLDGTDQTLYLEVPIDFDSDLEVGFNYTDEIGQYLPEGVEMIVGDIQVTDGPTQYEYQEAVPSGTILRQNYMTKPQPTTITGWAGMRDWQNIETSNVALVDAPWNAARKAVKVTAINSSVYAGAISPSTSKVWTFQEYGYVSMTIQAEAGQDIFLSPYVISGGVKIYFNQTNSVVLATGSPQRIGFAKNDIGYHDPSQLVIRLEVRTSDQPATIKEYFVGDLMVEKTDSFTLQPYFDGSFADTGSATYSWVGTPDYSESIITKP